MITFDKKGLRGGMFLFFAALFWGSAFVAQKICESYPFATNCIRFLLGAVFMIPINMFAKRINARRGRYLVGKRLEKKKAFKGAVICGVALAFASTAQQLGMFFGASAGKSGFLTSIYMVFIPIFGLFAHKKVGINVWLAVVIAFVGVALMSVKADFSIEVGDLVTLVCAFCYAIQVILVDKYIGYSNPITFSLIQLLTAGLICLAPLIVVNVVQYEVLTLEVLKHIILPILYIAIFSCCIAYTCQIFGQQYTPPAAASVIMSLESVFSLLFSIVLGGALGKLFGVDLSENLTVKVVIGIVLVFSAVMLAQFNPFKRKNKEEEKLETKE